MPALRLYFDEDAEDGVWIAALQRSGFDVSSALMAGRLGFSDPDQLAFASEQGRLLVSHNVGDFMRIHSGLLQSGATHSGFVMLAQSAHYSPGAMLERFLRMDRRITHQQMRNTVAFLSKFGPDPG